MTNSMRFLCVAVILAGLAPAPARAETVLVRGGSSLKGRLVQAAGDSLVFRLAVGATLPLHRSQILSIVFDDSVASTPPAAAEVASMETVRLRDASRLKGRLAGVEGDRITVRLAAGPAVELERAQIVEILFYDTPAADPASNAPIGPPETSAPGAIEVTFKDREISSKISIELKKDWDNLVRANHVVVEFLVDGAVSYTEIDTTMDKRIYHGHETQLKNDVKLADFKVGVPAGLRQCKLVVRSRGADEYRGAFPSDPLNLVLPLDNLMVRDGETTRVEVGIARGKLRMGKPRLYRVQ